MTAGSISELGWVFNPDEPRNAHGEWARAGSGYTAPDPSRLVLKKRPKNSPWPVYMAPTDHPFFQEHPVSAANVMRVYDQSTPQERAQGERWYADAHHLAKLIGQGDVVKGAGALAAYSPQTAWPVNMFNAARAIELGRALGPGEGMITRHMQASAQEALDGVPNDKNFGRNTAPKIRAFATLIEHGGDAPDDQLGNVVIDRHAMSVAMGVRLDKKAADKAPIQTDRYYQYVADAYRNAALEINRRDGTHITPYQLQAITWLHQQAANAAEDLAGEHRTDVAKSVGKGRQQMIRNAWQKWGLYAKQHHLDVNTGTTALTAGNISEVLLGWAGWEHEPRDSRGRWTRFGGTGEAADVAMKEREGFSVSPRTGEAPPGGYMVAQTGATHTYPESILDDHAALTRAIDDMLMSEPHAFASKDTYLGGWVHDGKLWLEPSDHFTSRQEAEQAGRDRNQIAIFDLNTFSEIQTGGSGGGKITEHDASGRRVRVYHEGPSLSAGWLPGAARTGAAGRGWQAGHGYPAGIAAQVLDLSWRDAWLHERRDTHGRWTRGGLAAVSVGSVMHKVGSALRDTSGFGTRSASPEIQAFTAKAAEAVPRIIGGGTQSFSGHVNVADKLSQPGALAQMEWDGDMTLRSDVADSLHSTLTSDKPSDPGPVEDILHELIHGVTATGGYRGEGNENQEAYQDLAAATVEEGFTELGAIQHAGEFFKAMGLDQHETPDTAYDDKTGRYLVGKQATFADIAAGASQQMQILTGDSWGHYESQVASAYAWVQQIAEMEQAPDVHKRVTELADEINQRGVAGKVDVMAAQVLSVAARSLPGGWGSLKVTPDVLDEIRTGILDGFLAGGGHEAVKRGVGVAKARIPALAAVKA